MTIRTQTLLIVTSLLVAAVLATAGVLAWSSRQAILAETEAHGLVIARLLSRSAGFGAGVMVDVEDAIGEQMIVEATIAAHMVAVAEAAALDPGAINGILGEIAEQTVLDEIWITDDAGHAYLRNIEDIDFTFSADAAEQPQAHEFWPLLTGDAREVVQPARQREVDTEVYKYAGVAGVDGPRIVQVGYHAALLEQLRERLGLTRLIDELIGDGSVIAIRILDRSLTTLEQAATLPADRLPEPDDTELARIRALVQAGQTRSYLEGPFLNVVAPIGEEGGALQGGAILVTLPTDRLQETLRRQTRLAIAVTGIVLLLGSIIGVLGARTITQPIADLTGMTGRIAGGDFSRSIAVRGKNELGTLAASFNEMTRRLNESIERLRVTTAAKERIESELAIAHEIQMSMVPKIFPPFPDRPEFEVFATLAPAKEVGGDFYDFFFIDDDRLCFAVGDVSGKGVPASLFMAVTKTLLKATAAGGGSPGEILARLNDEICRDNDSCMFVTLFCAILNVRTGEVDYSNGGHNLPYRMQRSDVSRLENTGGRALGLVPDALYASGSVVLGRGDSLLLYTDGVTEAMDEGETLYSDRRLERLLDDHGTAGPRELVNAVVDDVKRFADAVPQSDDITVLALRYRGAAGSADETLAIELANDVAQLDRLTHAVTELCRRHGIAPMVIHDLNLALEEAVTNVISYAYSDEAEHRVSVCLTLRGGELEAVVEDDGRPFDPLEAPAPDAAAPLEERRIGGLGIHLMRNVMDGLKYERRDGRNRLTMTKTLA